MYVVGTNNVCGWDKTGSNLDETCFHHIVEKSLLLRKYMMMIFIEKIQSTKREYRFAQIITKRGLIITLKIY